MSTPAISGPVPPYSNVNINPQYYQPRRFVISAVTLGVYTTITTTVAHDYDIGQSVRLIIPPSYGCRQLNERIGILLQIPASNQMVLNIDSSMNVDPFINSSATTKAQTISAGDINSGNVNMVPFQENINIPGSFINISPL